MQRKKHSLTRKDAKYVDITDAFFLAVNSMPKGGVIASPFFDMLEGARAVEMGNVKLDTGLIELKDSELSFDACQGQSLATVVAVMDSLMVLYMSWLQGLSLLVTVLSCRYVLDFLENFKAHPIVSSASFVNRRLHGPEYVCGTDYTHNLVNIVLRGFVVGLCKHIGFCRSVGISVLYDEEDLTTRSMDFDFLSQIAPESAVVEIEKAEAWMRSSGRLGDDESLALCMKFLYLVKQLVLLENILFIQLKLFAAKDLSIPCLQEALKIISELSNIEHVELPKGSVSRFVQLDCNNKHIPSPNYSITSEEAYANLKGLLESVQVFINQFVAVQNVGQLETLLDYTIAPKMTAEYNVIARGLFQLFFIRDDKSIAGLDESVGTISIRLMERLSLCGNSMMKPEEWTIQGPGNLEAIRASCLSKVSQLLDDVEAAVFQKLSVCGNNRCRQRQLNNRNIVVWDLLQFNAEQIELELFNFGIGDRIAPGVEQAALGVSSFVYFQKLVLMVDVALSGFEQELYKPYEAAHMFWLAGYFAQLNRNHLQTRVSQINLGKLASISALSKKIKKSKAGPKKDSMRQTFHRMEEMVAPQVQLNLNHIEKFLIPSNQALSVVCTTISHVIELLRSASSLLNTDPDALVDREKLYNLRMKPWSSVGVPEMPTFAQYCKSNGVYKVEPKSQRAITLAADMKERLNEAQKLLNNLIQLIEQRDTVVKDIIYTGGEEDIVAWFHALQKTCVAYQVELVKFTKLLKGQEIQPSLEHKSAESDCPNQPKYQLVSRGGYHPYFPIYSLAQS